MGWSPTRPIPVELIEPPPGWHPDRPTVPEPVPTRPGWWAVVALDTALTVQWVSEIEIDFLTGLGLEIVSIHATRSLALQKLGMVAVQRNIAVDSVLGLQGIYLTGMTFAIELQRAMTLQKVGLEQHVTELNFASTLDIASVKPIDVTAAVLATPTLAYTPIKMINLTQAITATPTFQLGAFLSIAFGQSINLSSALMFGFPPTAEVTDSYGTSGTTGSQNYTHTVRRWSNFNDLVILGGGGGGQGSGCCGVNGFGGGGGNAASMTLVRDQTTGGVVLGWDVVNWPVAIGGGGQGGTGLGGAIPGLPGAGGAASTMTTPVGTLSGSPGGGGFGGVIGADTTGGSGQTTNLNGKTYPGGNGGSKEGNGAWPGGGGGGATGGLFFGKTAGSGGRGRGWVRSYQ